MPNKPPAIQKSALRYYAKLISEATGYTNPAHLAEIEETMRQDIFHSTLDWQTRKVFDAGARMAVELLIELKILPGIDLRPANLIEAGKEQR